MSLNHKIHIIMGCYGYKDDDFTFCKGVDNSIFSFDNDHILYQEIMNYLDNCKLFDKPLYDYNAVRNFLSRFRQKFESPLAPVWIERKYNAYQKFAIDHKSCGLVLRLSLQKNEQPNNLEQKSSASNILKLLKK